jgi:hypothetical protein
MRTPLLFILSAILLIAVSMLIAARAARSVPERLWVLCAVTAAQLGALSLAASAFHAYSPTGFLLAQGLLVIGVLFVARLVARGADHDPHAAARGRRLVHARAPRDPVRSILIAATLMVLVISGLHRALAPVTGVDELNYHAARAAYWVQHQSIFPFETHNDRQTVFTFGAELFFAWPLMFMKSEAVARTVFWLAFPAAVIGLYTLIRSAGGARRAAAAGALLYAATPAVLAQAAGLKSDAWGPLFCVGAAFWLVRSLRDRPGRARRLFFAGLCVVLAVNIKSTTLALVPGALLVAALPLNLRSSFRGLAALGAGATVGLLLSGLGFLFVENWSAYRSPLGPSGLQEVVRPDFSSTQVYTHAVRIPLELFEPPTIPIEQARQAITAGGQRLSAILHADRLLPQEDNPIWPGPFVFYAHATAENYSLGGLLWLPILGFASFHAIRRLLATLPRPRLSRFAALVALQLPLFLGCAFLIRWMGSGPERFWLPAYALMMPLASILIGRTCRHRPKLMVVVALLLVWAVYPSLRVELFRARASWSNTPVDPLAQITGHIQPPARILLLSGEGGGEYPIFMPRLGFPNQVFLWGKQPFDEARLRDLLRDNAITHVVVLNDHTLWFHWSPYVFSFPMVGWLEGNPDFIQIRLAKPLRLFRLRALGPEAAPVPGSAPTPEPARPAFTTWQSEDGLGAVEGPYPTADLPSVRWGLGSLTILTFHSDGRPATLVMECRRNNAVDQTMTVLLNGQPVSHHEFGAAFNFEELRIPLHPVPGPNHILIRYTHPEDVGTDRLLSVIFRRLQLVDDTQTPR